MNSAEKYDGIWPSSSRTEEETDAIKSADHVLEMSTSDGHMVLEGLFHSSHTSSLHGKFLVWPPRSDKKLFHTIFAGDGGHCPLLRQCSDETRKSANFRVSCRPITARGIDMVFVVYPNQIQLELPSIIDQKTYKRIIDMPDVLVFKQVTPLTL